MKKYYRHFLIASLLVLVFGCNVNYFIKDRLRGDAEILVGDWQWVYTEREYASVPDSLYCDIDSKELIYPDSVGYDFSVNFEKKGVFSTYKSNEFLEDYDIHFDYFSPNGIDRYSFVFAPDKVMDYRDKVGGHIFLSDTLVISNYPFSEEDECEVYYNYFIRK